MSSGHTPTAITPAEKGPAAAAAGGSKDKPIDLTKTKEETKGKSPAGSSVAPVFHEEPSKKDEGKQQKHGEPATSAQSSEHGQGAYPTLVTSPPIIEEPHSPTKKSTDASYASPRQAARTREFGKHVKIGADDATNQDAATEREGIPQGPEDVQRYALPVGTQRRSDISEGWQKVDTGEQQTALAQRRF
jgi:hypothetical protein